MSFHISKPQLFGLSALFWLIAGVNVLRVGIVHWPDHYLYGCYQIAGSLLIFLFFILIFYRMFRKNVLRIEQAPGLRLSPLALFDAKGWGITLFMILLGVTVRRLGLFPGWLIATFYTGLGTALLLTGVFFLYHLIKQKA